MSESSVCHPGVRSEVLAACRILREHMIEVARSLNALDTPHHSAEWASVRACVLRDLWAGHEALNGLDRDLADMGVEP